MKVTSIKLNNYLHFQKGLQIDLTYPIGHKRAGEPLDKICFLGQSGTGKTTLLNLIKYFICENGDYDKKCIDLNKMTKNSVELFFQIDDDKYSKVAGDEFFDFDWYDYSKEKAKKINNPSQFKKDNETKIKDGTPLLISFPFSIVGPHDTSDTSSELPKNIGLKFDAPKGEIKDLEYDGKREIWDFNPLNIKTIWKIVFEQVANHITEYQNYELDFSKKIRQSLDKYKVKSKKIQETEKLNRKFKKWERETPNPIQNLADKCLNPILENFNLEVETDLTKYPIEVSSSERYVIIKSKNNGEEIKYPFLSTGTKQIMLTAIPLFFLDPKNTIILFDQPETSLYPNIQWTLPRIYLDIASKNNQFFFATHSPVVASAFDPWEIVELRFNEETGEVYRKEYYDVTESRNVNSYNINPKLLRWDSSYRKLFDLNKQGNPERLIKLRELSALEQELKKPKISAQRKKKLFDDYKRRANLLDWNIN